MEQKNNQIDLNDVKEKINYLNTINKGKDLINCYNTEFLNYGSVHPDIDISSYTPLCLRNKTESGITYLPGISELELLPVTECIREKVFGELPIQAGWCRGYNSSLNALEYHKSSEVIGAITDLILVVGKAVDIKEGVYNLNKVQFFFVPKYSVVELDPLVLHFAPIQADYEEFISIIILPKTTNFPLDGKPAIESIHDKNAFLFAKNKWLLAYPNTKQAEIGGRVALIGDKITLKV